MTIDRTPIHGAPAVHPSTGYKFVCAEGSIPRGPSRLGHIVVIPVVVSGYDQLSYGVIENASTQRAKASLPSIAWVVRVLVQSFPSDDVFIVPDDQLRFCTQAEFELDHHRFLYRWVLTTIGDVLHCGQVVMVSEKVGELELSVQLRGTSKTVVCTIAGITMISKTLFIIGFGDGQPAIKYKLYANRWCRAAEANLNKGISSLSDITKNNKSVVEAPHPGEQLDFLSLDGEETSVIVEEFVSNLIGGGDGDDSADDEFFEANNTNPVDPVKVKVSKQLDFDRMSETSSNLKYLPKELHDQAPLVPVDCSQKGKLAASEEEKLAHVAVFKGELLQTWRSKTMTDRARIVLRRERAINRYPATTTTTLMILFGDIASPLSYFVVKDMVPTSAKQHAFSSKWRENSEPKVFIESISDLVLVLNELVRIANMYYRPEVEMALLAIHADAMKLQSSSMGQAGVNAHRDHYELIIAMVMDAAIDGRHDELLAIARNELKHNSDTYMDTVHQRMLFLQIQNNVWGTAAKSTSNPRSGTSKLTAELREQIPKVNGKTVCLGFQSVRGCKRRLCQFEHQVEELPLPLQEYVKKFHGGRLK